MWLRGWSVGRGAAPGHEATRPHRNRRLLRPGGRFLRPPVHLAVSTSTGRGADADRVHDRRQVHRERGRDPDRQRDHQPGDGAGHHRLVAAAVAPGKCGGDRADQPGRHGALPDDAHRRHPHQPGATQLTVTWDALDGGAPAPRQVDLTTGNVSFTAQATRNAWAGEVAQQYFSTIAGALRAADPYHLFLGPRMIAQTTGTPVLEVAAKNVDAASFNDYAILNRPGFHAPSGGWDSTGSAVGLLAW